MKVAKSIRSIRTFVLEQKLNHSKIGFVPTMGALHKGHLKLINTSISENDITIASIFVNPTQFNRKDDFENYPETIEQDKKLLKSLGCDVLFLPNTSEMYPNEENVSFNFGYLEKVMEGKFRPGHFSGVGLIVGKLFNIVQPTRAYFGEKDLQQLTIVKKMTNDLNFDIEVIGVPTVRESNGLALSSRNMRLSKDEKENASNIFKGLTLTKTLILERGDVSYAKKRSIEFFAGIDGLNMEYLEVVDTNSLLPIKAITSNKKVSICIAAFIGNVRLIDNISFNT